MAKIEQVIPKPGVVGRFLALIESNSFLPFDCEVPRLLNGRPLETSMTQPDGSPKRGGAAQLAVRRLPEADFARIVNLGLPQDLERIEATRYNPQLAELGEGAEPFERPVLERLTRRPYRDVAFRRKVRAAYGYRCAMAGLMLRNGGGRPEVQAAHNRPAESQRSDSVRNGLALSGTLHWMFDRGLISIADDCETILVSWQENGRYENANKLIPEAFVQEHFVLGREPESGVVVINIHKSKSKEFDEVIIFDGFNLVLREQVVQGPFQRIWFDNAVNDDTKQNLRVAVTRSRSRTTILTPQFGPCGLLDNLDK
ncbi:HNH endonuclease [uncultured Sulfitobacter sp.]|uniref:HNH endonuclease n=1 Tax=uncultured Sulfitobacter sp. TaxID=191468 RepID=UPI0026081FB6|nr:HNH endonuclease [uncultured Sulfitobacter sp.]